MISKVHWNGMVLVMKYVDSISVERSGDRDIMSLRFDDSTVNTTCSICIDTVMRSCIYIVYIRAN